MPIILKYPISHSHKYDSAKNAGLEAKALFYEHINNDSTVEGLSYHEVFTIHVNKTACWSIPIRQNFLRLKL